MKKIIHHLRRQSEENRRHVLHFLTVVSAAFLLMLWVFSLGRTFGNEEIQRQVGEDLQPFSALKANLVGGYKSITEPDPYTLE